MDMIIKMINKQMVRINDWCKYNRTVSELSRLSNRELADLGMSRCDIYRIAKQSVHKQRDHEDRRTAYYI
jgi:uncharacterized protein YjiS (DUF1127 family)